MVPGGGGVGGEEVDVGHVELHAGIAGAVIQVGRHQDDPVQGHVVAREQFMGHASGADATIALAQHELGRGPAPVVAEKAHDEARHRVDVLVDAVEVRLVALADDLRETGAHRVDHDQVCPVEDAEFVLDRAKRTSGIRCEILEHGSLRAQDAHVQPRRG